MDFYQSQEHGCDIRNVCTGNDKCNGHTIRPVGYDTARHPGNWLGYATRCSGELESLCARLRS